MLYLYAVQTPFWHPDSTYYILLFSSFIILLEAYIIVVHDRGTSVGYCWVQA